MHPLRRLVPVVSLLLPLMLILSDWHPRQGSSLTALNGLSATPPGTVIGAFNVGFPPEDIAVNPTTDKLYVTNRSGNYVLARDEGTGIGTSIPSDSPLRAAVNPITDITYATDSGANTVSVINDATNSVSTTVTIGSGP